VEVALMIMVSLVVAQILEEFQMTKSIYRITITSNGKFIWAIEGNITLSNARRILYDQYDIKVRRKEGTFKPFGNETEWQYKIEKL